PGMAAPVGSLTLPEIPPRKVCAIAVEANKITRTAVDRVRRECIVVSFFGRSFNDTSRCNPPLLNTQNLTAVKRISFTTETRSTRRCTENPDASVKLRALRVSVVKPFALRRERRILL